MAFRHHTSHILRTAIIKVAAFLACLFLGAFFVRAQDSDAQVRVYFPFDSPALSASYMSNASAFAAIDSLASRIAEGRRVLFRSTLL